MSILEKIVAATRVRVAEAHIHADMRALTAAAETKRCRGFGERLATLAAKGPAIIAELKKASPSKGVMRGTLHVAPLAMQLEAAGAAALSVLTEPDFFQGSIADLSEARAACDLPLLRKDFIVDEFQLLEAKVNGADAVLLIVAALNDEELVHLHARARALGLDVLVEAHDESEVKRAMAAEARIIGVNSRNLNTFDVDLGAAARVAAQIPAGVLKVAESGITGGSDIRRLRDAGYQAFLVGETLMRAENPGATLSGLLKEAREVPVSK